MPRVHERPIIMQPESVRAILDGLKTQTRRIMKPQPVYNAEQERWYWPHPKGAASWGSQLERENCRPSGEALKAMLEACPYGKPGDLLWVRETWFDNCPGYGPENSELYYRADGIPDFEGEEAEMQWRPSIHMPRWASRLTLEITEVQVQRLQDITYMDALNEGVEPSMIPGYDYDIDGCFYPSGERKILSAFQKLWDSINGKREGCSWEANPWVWALSFKRVERSVHV